MFTNILAKLALKVGAGWAVVIVYGIAGSIILGGLGYGYHRVAEHFREQGRHEVQVVLDKHLSDENALTVLQKLENAQKKILADAKLTQVDTDRRLALEKLGLTLVNRDELTKKVSLLNAKLNETNVVIERNRVNTADSLRLSSERDRLKMSESTQVAKGFSPSDSDYANFRDACRLTTLDLIECQGIVEADTLACGRDN